MCDTIVVGSIKDILANMQERSNLASRREANKMYTQASTIGRAIMPSRVVLGSIRDVVGAPFTPDIRQAFGISYP